tara:strand:+ start:274 stop:525 length:252 start_codon:yes stop_codon:yes gene_type:complete
MLVPSLFDSFFAPTRVIVVSEERLQAAEREARQQQLDALDNRIAELTDYRLSLYNQLNPKKVNELNEKPGADLDALDGGTHDG